MTTLIPNQLIELYKKMLFISKAPKGQTPNFHSMEYTSRSFLHSIARTFYGEGRKRMREEIKKIAEEGCATLQQKRDTHYHQTLFDLILAMRKGIEIIRSTYSDCMDTSIDLEATLIYIDYNIAEEQKWMKTKQ